MQTHCISLYNCLSLLVAQGMSREASLDMDDDDAAPAVAVMGPRTGLISPDGKTDKPRDSFERFAAAMQAPASLRAAQVGHAPAVLTCWLSHDHNTMCMLGCTCSASTPPQQQPALTSIHNLTHWTHAGSAAPPVCQVDSHHR